MRNIALVGFMGTGKTVVAKAIAREVGKKYVSLDDAIEKREKRKISEIFRDEGEPYFRKVEKEVAKEISEKNDQVIDTGGGVVLDERNIKTLKKGGIIICLWAELEVIYERTRVHSHRPLLEVDAPRERIKELLEQRRSCYEKADFHIDTTGLSIAVIVDRVKAVVKDNGGKKTTDDEKANTGDMLKDIFFKKLLGNVNAFVMVSDEQGSIVFTNKRYLDFFGLSERSAKGKNWIDLVISPAEKKSVQVVFEEIKAKGEVYRFDTSAVTPYSSEKHLLWLAIPLTQKKVVFYMFVAWERKYSEGGGVEQYAFDLEKATAAQKEIVEMLFDASSISEPWLADHAARVVLFSVALAKEIKMDPEKIEKLRVASVLHDLGKLAVDKNILLKKGKLTKSEFEKMKKHSGFGAAAANLVYFLNDIVPIIISHHENFDGSGYPGRLKGSRIPLEARVLSIADIFEALTSDRPYRKKFSVADAIDIMNNEKGRKLDPKLTDIFLDMVKNGKLKKWEVL